MKEKIAIIGLGYVGLPLSIAFNKNFKVVGFDIDKNRIKQLTKLYDETNEVSKKELKDAKQILFTSDEKKLDDCDIFIVTVPTPINKVNSPDLSSVISATKMISRKMKQNSIVIYESTTFPGCTEEICVPILKRHTKLTYNKSFFCGYSPERVNPGDKKRKLNQINKIVSASNKTTLDRIFKIYNKSLKSKIIKVKSIKIAEGAKIIENTQRDLNIALMNEFSIIFEKLNINFEDVLNAAKTKWNFIPFKPGLVGGHCIGVDPYYLAYKSKKIGYNPKVLLAGRKLNDSMSKYEGNLIYQKLKNILNPKVLVMGLSFKENVPDIRNSKSFDLINFLIKKRIKVDCYDDNVNRKEVFKNYKILPTKRLKKKYYDTVVILVAHNNFINLRKKIKHLVKDNGIIYDFQNIYKTNKKIIKINEKNL
jgi:UDP-N-acetyl-D-galactosamine dehydrogenase